jgi:hypothetical protein
MTPSISQSEFRNPYYHTSMVRDPHLFFGRADALKRIFSVIRDQQCLSLVGPRRIGKSSLLAALRAPEYQADFAFPSTTTVLAYIDTSTQPFHSYEDFLEFMAQQLLLQNPGQLSWLHLQDQPAHDASRFRQFLEEIHAHNLYPVLLLDEFEHIAGARQFDPSFFFFLRAQANMGLVSYITASKDTPNSISHDDLMGSPFFNIFTVLRLGPLSKQDATDLITIPSRDASIPFTPTETSWVLDIAGRHPFFLQRSCHFLFETKTADPHANVDLSQIEFAIYDELLPHFQYAWRHLDPESQEQLAWEARREGVSRRNLPELSEGRLFRTFVCKETSIDLSTITLDYLETLLDRIDDPQFLGKSTLAYFNLLYLQAHGTTLSAIERGLAVKRIILTSIDELRPGRQQDHDETQLRLYQILNWRYKEKLNNDQITARLAISPRHFFRERVKALRALLNALLEKEAQSKIES